KDMKNKRVKGFNKGEKYLGLINLEMIGWSTKNPARPLVKLYTRPESQPGGKLDRALADAVAKSAGQLPLSPQILGNGFNRSDNWPFWVNGFSSVTISEDWENDFNEKNYHTAGDLPESLNYSYLQSITRLLKSSVQTMTN